MTTNEEARPEHSYEAIRADIISALATDGFAYLEAEQLVRLFEGHVLGAVRSWFDDYNGTDPGVGGWYALEVNLEAS